jgi:hypothetical protein
MLPETTNNWRLKLRLYGKKETRLSRKQPKVQQPLVRVVVLQKPPKKSMCCMKNYLRWKKKKETMHWVRRVSKKLI